MSGKISVTRSENKTTISITGRFTFRMTEQFRDVYQNESPSQQFTVDLAGTQEIDSSGLGMLLLLSEYADASGVELINANPRVRQAIEMANISSLFKMA